MSIVAVRRNWFALSPDGEEHDIEVSLSAPFSQSAGVWSVEASLGALQPGPLLIHGEDSWQAMSLGMQFIATRVRHCEEDGWRFLWERGGEEALASELFTGV